MGFKDGTRNLTRPSRLRGVRLARRRRRRLDGRRRLPGGSQDPDEHRDLGRRPIGDQQRVFGRTKVDGRPADRAAPSSTTPDFHAKGRHGATKIDPRAHIALAAHENNGGIRILRRAYNYTDGINAVGQLDAGLLFIAYMNDPEHFVRLQTRLGSSDLLNEYISHIGSAIFAVPPAPRSGEYVGEALFG